MRGRRRRGRSCSRWPAARRNRGRDAPNALFRCRWRAAVAQARTEPAGRSPQWPRAARRGSRAGLRPDTLADILAELKAKGVRPKYIYTIPSIQNPTGSILPLDRREQLLSLARQYGVLVFEDECYADLLWSGVVAPPSLYALDPAHVIHIGSFSKSLSPSLRLGYVAADWSVLSRLTAEQTDSVRQRCSAFKPRPVRLINQRLVRSPYCRSTIWGVSFALHAEAIYDRRSGRIVNANLAEYKIPSHADTGDPGRGERSHLRHGDRQACLSASELTPGLGPQPMTTRALAALPVGSGTCARARPSRARRRWRRRLRSL